jgi:hypothetical protein
MMIDQYPGKSKIHENIIKKMPLPPPKQRNAYGTYLYFAEPATLKTFMRDYRQILYDNFQKYEPKAAANIGLAAVITIPGICTGNPGSILNGCAENGVLMILP